MWLFTHLAEATHQPGASSGAGSQAGCRSWLAGLLASVAIDWIGIMLAASVLFWIPTHIMTFNIRYLEDYTVQKCQLLPGLWG